MSNSTAVSLPETNLGDWDMTPFFPEFQGEAYRQAWDDYSKGSLKGQLQANSLGALSSENLDSWTQLLVEWEALGQKASHLGCYLGCLRAADSKNEAVAKDYAAFQNISAEFKKLDVLILDMLRNASQEQFESLLKKPEIESACYVFNRLRLASKYLMSADLETLAAELEVDGFSAWGRLYDQVSGRLEFQIPDGQGGQKTVPMAHKVSLLENPDPVIRKAALENSNAAWSQVEDVIGACLNAIAGTRLTLYRRRGIANFLQPALFESAITQKTLEAMMGAIEASYEIPRRFLKLKAKLLGKQQLGFQDLSAPLPLESHSDVSWTEAQQRLNREYSRHYPGFAEFCQKSFDKNWIDYQPREGKRQGGFCAGSTAIKESRIFMTYNNTLGDVQTLAHELGHAFHNHVMRDQRPLNQQYPMTLAETASTFAETLLTDSILQSPDTSDLQKATILDTRLEGAAAFLLNIPMRFQFEKKFYQERANGEVSVSRLKELLLEAQRNCYGDVLNPEEMDPYFWASKLHFYITEVSFYNFPYSFGFLFSLGVYARAKAVGSDFFAQYEELLRLTGSDTAENVAKRSLGVDLEAQDFWLQSIALVEKDLVQFEELIAKLGHS